MSLICKIFGHSYRFTNGNVAEESVCRRCGDVRPAIEWPRMPDVKKTPPMPKLQELPAFNDQVLAELTEIKNTLKAIQKARKDGS